MSKLSPTVTSLIFSVVSLGLSIFALSLPFILNPSSPPGAFPITTDPKLPSIQAEQHQILPDQSLIQQGQRIEKLENQLGELEKVVQSANFNNAPVAPPPLDEQAPLLAHLGEQYATRAQFEEHRKQSLKNATVLRQSDKKRYGAPAYKEIQELATQARPRRGYETEEQRTDRETALKSLMTSYPEAYTTQVAVAEQALSEAINRNPSNVESYYQSLINSSTGSSGSEVITEQGIDAIPTLQSYLARQYVSEGRYDEATAILNTMSSNSDRVIMEPNEMGEPTTHTVQSIVSELRQKIPTKKR